MITMQDAETLLGALRMLDAGSVDQCDPAKTKDAKPSEIKPCQYKKNKALLQAMAQDMVTLQPLDTKFKILQNAVRLEVLCKVDEICGAGTSGDGATRACNSAKAQQDSRYFDKMVPIWAQQEPVSLTHIKWADLDVGEAPDHNRLPADMIAGLRPMIDDWAEATK
jgi:hypothetical protein